MRNWPQDLNPSCQPLLGPAWVRVVVDCWTGLAPLAVHLLHDHHPLLLLTSCGLLLMICGLANPIPAKPGLPMWFRVVSRQLVKMMASFALSFGEVLELLELLLLLLLGIPSTSLTLFLKGAASIPENKGVSTIDLLCALLVGFFRLDWQNQCVKPEAFASPQRE